MATTINRALQHNAWYYIITANVVTDSCNMHTRYIYVENVHSPVRITRFTPPVLLRAQRRSYPRRVVVVAHTSRALSDLMFKQFHIFTVVTTATNP